MEVLIGFAVGYWVGTRQGREGMQRVVDSAREIWESPEARRLVSDGLSAVQGRRRRRLSPTSSERPAAIGAGP